jgi:hypothetical protein
MSETVFTFPGKCGDAIMQFPIAYWWSKQHGGKFTAWLDDGSCRMLVPLFEAQPCVESVKLIKGVKGYQCGGQPFHFDLPTLEYENRNIYHLGMRVFPQRQLTLECLATTKTGIEVPTEDLAETPCFEITEPVPKVNRLVVHGQGVCPHTKTTPGVWKFLASIRDEIPALFDEVVLVGSDRDRQVGKAAYPNWSDYDDGGDFLKLARLIQSSAAVIGCGSSIVALAGALKIPCIRVHDPISITQNDPDGAPRRIWDNLGNNQMNETPAGLRIRWPEFRDKWLLKEEIVGKAV